MNSSIRDDTSLGSDELMPLGYSKPLIWLGPGQAIAILLRWASPLILLPSEI